MRDLAMLFVVVLLGWTLIGCSCGDDDDDAADDDSAGDDSADDDSSGDDTADGPHLTAEECSVAIQMIYVTCASNVNDMTQNDAMVECVATPTADVDWFCIQVCVDALPDDCAGIITCVSTC